ncbi:fibronectin type III domain-containing protein [Acetobacterium sp.]|uniref:fibronectin type III domain-containing protein n=1 Tax=Acetobacterium sp. TaxID=1872094 RepID=UPI003593BF12
MKRMSVRMLTILIMALLFVWPGVLAAGNAVQFTNTIPSDQGKSFNIAAVSGICYRTHVQNIGWETNWAQDGGRAGTEGLGLRLEGIQIKLTGDELPAGAGVEYRTHIQNIGWETDGSKNGATSGTEGLSLRLEGIQIRLINMPGYSVEYRTHIQNLGWETNWARDGEPAGTEGYSYRLEAIEIRLIKPSSALLAPEGLETKVGKEEISLSWMPVDEAKSYTLYEAVDTDDYFMKVDGDITGTSYTVKGLDGGRRYYFKVKASSGVNESPFSEVVTAIASVDSEGNVLLGNRIIVSNESEDLIDSQPTGALITTTEVMETTISNQQAFARDAVLPFKSNPEERPIEPSMLETSEVEELNKVRDFYTYNFATDSMDITQARLAYIGSYVQVWVDINAIEVVISDDTARSIGSEFDDIIYPLITENFYTAPDVNGDGKIAILCFDLQDGYTGSSPNSTYYTGYFYAGDLYDEADSNKMEILYADTNPTITQVNNTIDMSQFYSTIVYQFQHMVNFNCNGIVEEGEGMEIWLDETLSEAAVGMYAKMIESAQASGESYVIQNVNLYNNDEKIKNGLSLMRYDVLDDASSSNYVLSFFFSQYLRTQIDAALGETGHNVKVFNEIITDRGTATEAVERTVQKHIDPLLTFGDFITNFRAAMLLKADGGYFGFNAEEEFDELSTPLYTGGSTSLYGGGAIVIANQGPFTIPTNRGNDISFLGIFN